MPDSAPPSRSLKLQRTTAALAQSDRWSWAPLVAAVAIDLADLATAGPIGLLAGLFVGGVLTTIVAKAAGAESRRALGLGVLGGIYCAMPFTEAVPLATILTLVHGLLQRSAAPAQPELAPVQTRVVQAGPPRRT